MTTMPAMPKAGAKGSTGKCACGCGGATKRTWTAGHDGRATGWALRVERGVLALADVPANERAGAEIMLVRRAAEKAKAGAAA